MSVGMKRWSLGFASITALALGLVVSSGELGMNQAEAASPEQYPCGSANRYERFVAHYPWLEASKSAGADESSSGQVLDRTPGQCDSYTACGEFSDSVHQFHVPMMIWNGPENCGSTAAAGLPLLLGGQLTPANPSSE